MRAYPVPRTGTTLVNVSSGGERWKYEFSERIEPPAVHPGSARVVGSARASEAQVDDRVDARQMLGWI